MSARLLPLLAAFLALAGLAHAAPAPFQKTPDLPEVTLHGALPDASLAIGAPQVIVSQADYLSLAKAWGIADPPKVNFRTHFLAVYLAANYGQQASFEVDDRGDLRAVTQVIRVKCRLGGPLTPRFQIRSFHRATVKTVNGDPLPKK